MLKLKPYLTSSTGCTACNTRCRGCLHEYTEQRPCHEVEVAYDTVVCHAQALKRLGCCVSQHGWGCGSSHQCYRAASPSSSRCPSAGIPGTLAKGIVSYLRAGRRCWVACAHTLQILNAIASEQDGVRQPYDDVIPYWRFSVRLHKADLPQLEELLGGIHEERITALQYGLMKCVPPHLHCFRLQYRISSVQA